MHSIIVYIVALILAITHQQLSINIWNWITLWMLLFPITLSVPQRRRFADQIEKISNIASQATTIIFILFSYLCAIYFVPLMIKPEHAAPFEWIEVPRRLIFSYIFEPLIEHVCQYADMQTTIVYLVSLLQCMITMDLVTSVIRNTH